MAVVLAGNKVWTGGTEHNDQVLDATGGLWCVNAGHSRPTIVEAIRKAALESMIEERVLVTHARENGPRVDEAELDRVVGNVAIQNKLTMPQLLERLKAEGIDYTVQCPSQASASLGASFVCTAYDEVGPAALIRVRGLLFQPQ